MNDSCATKMLWYTQFLLSRFSLRTKDMISFAYQNMALNSIFYSLYTSNIQ